MRLSATDGLTWLTVEKNVTGSKECCEPKGTALSAAVDDIVAAHAKMFKNVGPDATRDHSMRCMELAASLWSKTQDNCNPFANLRGFAVGAGTLGGDPAAEPAKETEKAG